MDFTRTTLSLHRPLGSYAKLQALYGALIRNRTFQLAKLRTDRRRYLNLGCGPNLSPHFINLDYQWRPKLDLCWDITGGIPLGVGSMKGIFTEHCIEHLTFSQCTDVLRDCFRLLKEDGVIRIIVPDAELYLRAYTESNRRDATGFPYVTPRDGASGLTPMMVVNRVFRDHGHLYAYDFHTLAMMLGDAGFAGISKESYMIGRDHELLVDSENRRVESLYIEASKPA